MLKGRREAVGHRPNYPVCMDARTGRRCYVKKNRALDRTVHGRSL